jgi:hypothetical protein
MDIMDGESRWHGKSLWLWRIIVQYQREVFRQLRIFIQDLEEGRNRLTLRKLAFVKNSYRQYRCGQRRSMGGRRFHWKMFQVRSTRQYNSRRRRIPTSLRSSDISAIHHAMAAVDTTHSASTAGGAGSIFSFLQNG